MLSINRILCAVDFSDFSRDALRHGVALAKWYSAELTLFHAYQVSQPLSVTAAPVGVPPYVAVEPDKVAQEVRAFCGPVLASAGQKAEIVVRPGDPAREIRREAETGRADLLILGTHGRSGFERLFLGSVTEKVLRSTSVPVLTIPPPVREPGPQIYRTILCPIDFSDTSIRALEYALSLAKESDARLILLHVLEDVLGAARPGTLGDLTVADYARRREAEAVARLGAVLPDDARVWCHPEERVVTGRAYNEILTVVAEASVDLVVMGVQGTGALNRLVFGSTTHRVIREASCPVLTLRAQPR